MKYTAPKNSRSRSRIFNSRKMFVALAAFALLALLTTSALMTGLTGAVFTSNSTCDGTDLNIYFDKGDVYLEGGPHHGGSAGLPDGYYYVKVEAPGGTLLGTSVGSGFFAPGGSDGQVVHVTNGVFDACYKLADIVKTAAVAGPPACSAGDPGYCDTTNGGGEYKVWVSQDSTFPEAGSKTDNFKVKSNPCAPDDPNCNPRATINVIKFYDANTNGVLDNNEISIEGWKVNIAGDNSLPFDAFTTVQTIVDPDCYTVNEYNVVETNWLHTTATSEYFCVVGGQSHTTTFGNVCIAGGTGLTLGFWSNKNGQGLVTAADIIFLNNLCLRDAAGNDLLWNSGSLNTNKNSLKNFLLSATATNMANMLSAQLTAMELNVAHGFVTGSSLVYAPCLIGKGANALGFININDLMAFAAQSLCNNGNTTAAGTARTYQECLKTALDDANNNRNFVSPTPCAFSFAP